MQQDRCTLTLALLWNRSHRLLQVPSMNANWGLIDVDTPKSAMTIPSYFNPKQEMELVFSDEFNTDGRTFYPGDDPYWEAADLHYWAVRPRILFLSHESHLNLID